MGCVHAVSYTHLDQAQFEAYLERFRLDGGQPIKNYSRGMRMKLNLALAMSHHARLLILDEPASGLDPVVREGLLELLEDFVGDEEHGVLVSSHIISDLEKVSDYVALLHRGEMLLFEEKDALLESFACLLYTSAPGGVGLSRCRRDHFSGGGKAGGLEGAGGNPGCLLYTSRCV